MAAAEVAGRRAPLIQNEWYVAFLSEELGKSLEERQILGRSLLFYRKRDGTPVAMQNRCPHRGYPLSKGVKDRDEIICGFHGLRFAATGRCTAVPSQGGKPPVIAARVYPLIEKPPFIWIWMGDPGDADPALLPDREWTTFDPATDFSGYLYAECSYVRLHENALDLTSYPFIYGETAGGLDFVRTASQVTVKGDSVRNRRILRGEPINDGYGSLIGNMDHLVNRTSESCFVAPGLHVARALIEDLDGGIEGQTVFGFDVAHVFTPETANTTHYFYNLRRNFRTTDADLTEVIGRTMHDYLLEGVLILEEIEKLAITDCDPLYREWNVPGDAAGLAMRRILAMRAQAEAGVAAAV